MAERNSREKVANRKVECRGYKTPPKKTEKIVGADQKKVCSELGIWRIISEKVLKNGLRRSNSDGDCCVRANGAIAWAGSEK